MTDATMTLAEVATALEGDLNFQVTRQGVRYDVGYGEGDVSAWPAGSPEETPSVIRFGNVDPFTAHADGATIERVYRWINTRCIDCGARLCEVTHGAYRGMWYCEVFCFQFGPAASYSCLERGEER